MWAIKFEQVGKQYRLGQVSTRTLGQDLRRWFTLHVRGGEDPFLALGARPGPLREGVVWALRDLSLEIAQGEVVGLIGRNGSGKSTLLKLLGRVTAPTTGCIRARGRIASLLEVGTGFHPELTGRENLFMNGAILGMRRAELVRKLDEIVAFSGCERYLDTPVKRYSSGMRVRLGFAIAAHLEPDILIVDEVLAVGDAQFRAKALGKMQAVSRGEGRTVLFVSHNMASVRSLCTRGLLLDGGLLVRDGDIASVVAQYGALHAVTSLAALPPALVYKAPYLEWGNLQVNGGRDPHLRLGPGNRCLEVRLEVVLAIDTPLAFEARFFHRGTGEPFAFFSPALCTGRVPLYRAGRHVLEVRIPFPVWLNACELTARLALTQPGTAYHLRLENVLTLTVEPPVLPAGEVLSPGEGLLFLPPEGWESPQEYTSSAHCVIPREDASPRNGASPLIYEPHL